MKREICLLVLMMLLMGGDKVGAEELNPYTMEEDALVYQVIAREATSGCFDDYIGLARLIRYRIELGWWGDTLRKVILAPEQFKCIKKWSRQVERTPGQLVWAKEAWEISKIPTDFPATHILQEWEHPSWEGRLRYLTTIAKHRYFQEIR